MVRIALAAVAAVIATTAPLAAAPTSPDATQATDLSAQARVKKRVPQIRVTPRYFRYPYRLYNSPYPVPYDIEYPGPNAKRACVARLVPEARPSGPVIVPRMQCRWVRG